MGSSQVEDRTTLVDHCLYLIYELRELRYTLHERGRFNLYGMPLFVRDRFRYWHLSKELESALEDLSVTGEGLRGWDAARFERNYERLKKYLGGWKLLVDSSLATMAATLRRTRTD